MPIPEGTVGSWEGPVHGEWLGVVRESRVSDGSEWLHQFWVKWKCLVMLGDAPSLRWCHPRDMSGSHLGARQNHPPGTFSSLGLLKQGLLFVEFTPWHSKFASKTWPRVSAPGLRFSASYLTLTHSTQSVTEERRLCASMKACSDVCDAWSWPDTVVGCVFPELNDQGWHFANMFSYFQKQSW